MDVLSASYRDDKIAWYENDGNENFSSHTITTAADEMWTATVIWMCSPLLIEMIKSPGMKTTVMRISAPIPSPLLRMCPYHHHQYRWGQFSLCGGCGRRR
jgi:hypothetical protein